MAQPVPDPRFPIGPFVMPNGPSDRERARFIDDLARTPQALREAVTGLDEHKLETPYRDAGWTVRQVVHHVADSHVNAYCRFKFTLTESNPTIKPYLEAAWAELPDSKTVPVEVSLQIVSAIHTRWLAILAAMIPSQWQRTYIHPERGQTMTLDQALALYSWHSRHHVAHITTLRRQKSW